MNPWRDLKRMNREVWLLCATSLINRMGTMVLPFLVLYLTREMGLAAGRAGFVLAAYGVGSLVSAPLSGKLCDRIGALRVMKGSLFLSGLLFVAYPWIKSYSGILAISFVLALVGDAFRPASMVILTELVPSEDRKVAFALYRLALNLGMSVGPAVGGFLAMISFPSLFYVDGTTCILAALG